MNEKLQPYYESSTTEMAERMNSMPLRYLEQRILDNQKPPGFVDAINNQVGVSVVAEHKRWSPSEGNIQNQDGSPAWTAYQYQQGGAAALSVLTNRKHFGGKIEDLDQIYQSLWSDIPILRKDFISDPYQLYEARAFGASAALLIVAGLRKNELEELNSEGLSIGLDMLIEVHDERELERALELEPSLIGINNRDLTNMKVNIGNFSNLSKKVPSGVTMVAESGYDINKQWHYSQLLYDEADAVLIGTSLMREFDPSEALSKWLNNQKSTGNPTA